MVNQSIGLIIAAILKTNKYKRATAPPTGDNNYQPAKRYLANIVPMTAVLQEVYQYQADVTEHAVEDGVVFSDHVILKPLRFEIEFEVGNYDGLGSDAQLAKDALDKMIAAWRSRQLFSLLTTHRLLENVVCTHIRASNDAPEWGKLSFKAIFQQVNLVQLEGAKLSAEKVTGAPLVNATTPQGGPAVQRSAVQPSAKTKKRLKPVPMLSGVYSPRITMSSFEYLTTYGWR